MKAFIIDQVSPKIRSFLTEQGISVDEFFLPSHQELKERIGQYDLLVMRVDPFIDREILDAATNLKAITVAAVGTNHIDLEYAAQKGIQIANAPGRNSNTVAELTMSKMLDLARNAIPANNAVKEKHSWNKYVWTGIELQGKTLGIIGFGKIGSRVAKLAQGFDMKVIAYDPFLSREAIQEKMVRKATLQELLAQSDVISLHCPLKSATKGLISSAEFEQMKKGVIVLNMARGGVLHEQAAYDALKSKKVRGIGVDVMDCELSGDMGQAAQCAKGESVVESPLFEFENFIVSPHIAGGGTIDGLDLLGDCVIDQICEIFGYQRQTTI